MKAFTTFLLGIATVIVLFIGHSYWNQRIEAAPKDVPSLPDHHDTTDQEISEDKTNQQDLTPYIRNWPKSSADRFQLSLKEKRPFTILFVGSPAIGSDTAGTFPIVKKKLVDTFGGKNIQVGIKTYTTTSSKFAESNELNEIAAEKADLIIFEPFILMNNGQVLIENTLKDVTKMMNDVKAKNPEITFILQPSYPVYKAKIYPNQVAALKKYAEDNQITYLDHWSAWPDSNTETLKEYLTPDQSAPSEKGAQAWSDFLIKYLISE